MVENDAKQLDSIEFIRGKDTTVLKAIDLHTLEQDEGKLSNEAMDWFVFWLNPQVLHLDVSFVSPYMSSQPITLMNDEHFNMDMIEGFYRRSKGLWQYKSNTLIVPILDSDYWTLAVLSKHQFLKFDSVYDGSWHGTKRLHTLLGRLWALHVGVEEFEEREIAGNMQSWRHAACLRQTGKTKCGWMTIWNIVDYCARHGFGAEWKEKAQ